MTMMTATRDEMMYCPGCSHAVVLEQLGAGLGRLELPPERVCLVSDIGCIGTADRYFTCHTFHGLHGRSITYAEGIKRRCPDLTVVVLIGDGGCGIGTAHLVHTARRGVGIKVFVCNNFNFGMTGGQHSPTTFTAGVTATTPSGAPDPALDICQLAIASGAPFVARCRALDRNFGEFIDATLKSPGFGLLDIWELCTAYYMSNNKLTPQTLIELSDRLKMPFGILRDAPVQSETTTTPVEKTPARREEDAAAARGPAAVPRLQWPTRVEIALAGSAGQRIRSAASVIGEVMVAAGLHVAQADDYPISVRKGYSLSNLIIAPQPIRYTGLDTPNLLIIQSEDGLKRLGDLSQLPESTVVVADDRLELPPTRARVHRVALKPLSQQIKQENVALALLAHGLVRCGWITAELLQNVSDAAVRGRFRDVSLRAIQAGIRLGSEIESAPAPIPAP